MTDGSARAHSAAAASEAPHRASILVADDIPANRKVVVMMLGELGYEADTVSSGREAVAAVCRKPCDVLFMDVQMPGLDGLAAARRINEILPPQRRPYIVAMTAATTSDTGRFREAGMADFLAKPVDLRALRLVLERAGQRARGPDRPRDDDSSPAREPPAVPPGWPMAQGIDPSPLALLHRLDAGGTGRAVELYLDGLGARHRDLEGAIEDGRGEETVQLAHGLKGSSASLGAVELAALSAELEQLGRAGDLAPARRRLGALGEAVGRAESGLAGILRAIRQQSSGRP